jgi:hypothetical protein
VVMMVLQSSALSSHIDDGEANRLRLMGSSSWSATTCTHSHNLPKGINQCITNTVRKCNGRLLIDVLCIVMTSDDMPCIQYGSFADGSVKGM